MFSLVLLIPRLHGLYRYRVTKRRKICSIHGKTKVIRKIRVLEEKEIECWRQNLHHLISLKCWVVIYMREEKKREIILTSVLYLLKILDCLLKKKWCHPPSSSTTYVSLSPFIMPLSLYRNLLSTEPSISHLLCHSWGLMKKGKKRARNGDGVVELKTCWRSKMKKH